MNKELINYFSKVQFKDIEEREYLPTQIGSKVRYINEENWNIDDLDIILLGVGEFRGQDKAMAYSNGPDKIREELFQLHYWHEGLMIGDFGNMVEGNSLNDSRAALKTILSDLYLLNKKVLILGGSHDLTAQQYEVFKSMQKVVDFTVIDMLADLNEKPEIQHDNYLFETFTSTPNFLRNFNLIGFQSYYINPNIIETFDKLRFDCFRLGKVREDIEQMEPLLRSSDIASLDINCVKYSDAPSNKFYSPNGFTGDEICKITRFAGMSSKLHSFGIFGYIPENDTQQITAKLISQMIWYYFDGLYIQKEEYTLDHKDGFLIYHVSLSDNEMIFYKSKRTNRWWMQVTENNIVPCSYQDYQLACQNEIPERWLREMERSV